MYFIFKLEQEIDMILGKKDVVKNAVAEWTGKWTPAIHAYSKSMRTKVAQTIVKDVQEMYKGVCDTCSILVYIYTIV